MDISPKKTYRWSTDAEKMLNVANYKRYAKESCKEVSTSHRSEWPSSKPLQTVNDEEGVEKRPPPPLQVGMEIGAAPKKSSRGSLKEIKLELPYDPSSLPPGHTSVKGKNSNLKQYRHRDVHGSKYSQWRRQGTHLPKCPPTGEGIKICSIHTKEH